MVDLRDAEKLSRLIIQIWDEKKTVGGYFYLFLTQDLNRIDVNLIRDFKMAYTKCFALMKRRKNFLWMQFGARKDNW